jgi:hypothetical protein
MKKKIRIIWQMRKAEIQDTSLEDMLHMDGQLASIKEEMNLASCLI